MKFELTSDFNSADLLNTNLKSDILRTNDESIEYGLMLSEKDAQMLAQAGKDAIELQDRVEFGKSATIKIINRFMKSSYIGQNEYADIIAELIDIFYQAKEESLDILTDDEIINAMYDFFENESGGDIEILRSRDMDVMCRMIRDMIKW